ncbi:MAG: hypothetical protein U0326_09375 [Polyangiales bacterium]
MKRYPGFADGMFALVASCGLDMMSDSLDQYDQHMGYAQTEVTSHAMIANGAAVAEVSALEDAHLARMLGHMGTMRGDVRQMMTCGSADGAGMMGAMDDFERECRAHRSALTGATEPMALRAEEDRHQQAMRGMMDRMRSHSASMMSSSGGMRCGH